MREFLCRVALVRISASLTSTAVKHDIFLKLKEKIVVFSWMIASLFGKRTIVSADNRQCRQSSVRTIVSADNRQCGQLSVRTIVSADNCQGDICQEGHLSKNKYFKTYRVGYRWKGLDFLILNLIFVLVVY